MGISELWAYLCDLVSFQLLLSALHVVWLTTILPFYLIVAYVTRLVQEKKYMVKGSILLLFNSFHTQRIRLTSHSKILNRNRVFSPHYHLVEMSINHAFLRQFLYPRCFTVIRGKVLNGWRAHYQVNSIEFNQVVDRPNMAGDLL